MQQTDLLFKFETTKNINTNQKFEDPSYKNHQLLVWYQDFSDKSQTRFLVFIFVLNKNQPNIFVFCVIGQMS